MLVGLFQNLIDILTASSWTYLLLLAICAGDAVLPLLPSESALIVCGIQAARGELSLGWVIFFGALGALIGDNTSYALGRYVGKPITDRFFSGERARARLEWAHRFLEERGSYILIIARFIPGGRTAATFTSGLVHLRWLTQFLPYVVVAAIFWATFAAFLGYLGGRTFENQPILALLLAFGIAAIIGGLAELIRRRRMS
jgi:membrane protein DedA with SNARE-associated domain